MRQDLSQMNMAWRQWVWLERAYKVW